MLLFAYAGALLHVSRRTRSGGGAPASFFVNDRSSGAWSVATSLLVSCVGASATMGMAGMAFQVGAPAFWWLGAGAIGITLLAALLAAKVRACGAFTMPEMVESLLGPDARPLISAVIVLAWTAILAAQFSAAGRLLAAMTGFGRPVCILAGFVLIVLHTMGGQAVVMRTDRLQCGILLAGLAVLLGWLHHRNPGWMENVTFEATNSGFDGGDLAHCLFVIGGNYLVCPMLFGRFLSATDAGAARRGGFLAGAGLAACAALIVLVGLACRGLAPADTPRDAVLTTAVAAFPRWLAAPTLLALISAVVSSADSCLVTAATVLSHDLLRTDKRRTCRLCVAGLGCAGALLTFMDRDILRLLLMAYDIYVAGVVMPVFLALVSAPRLRMGRPRLALAAIVCGGFLGCLAAFLEEPAFSYAGMAVSAALTAGGLRRGKK